MKITDLLIKYIDNPKDSNICFQLGLEYEVVHEYVKSTL